MTCTLTLYNTDFFDNKNYVMDDIQTFLNNTSIQKYIIDDYQYQRFELYKSIKVNIDQSEQIEKQWKYVCFKVLVDEDNNEYMYYYYFVMGRIQKAQSTIEFELKMDTLNTFKYNSTESRNGYTLSEKTLVQREHKDRFVGYRLYAQNLATTFGYDKWYIINKAMGFLGTQNLFFTFLVPPSAQTQYSNVRIAIIKEDGSVEENTLYTALGRINYFANAQGQSFEIITKQAIRTFTIDISKNVAISFETLQVEGFEDNFDFDTLKTNLLSATYKLLRKIEKYSEGLDTFLFKKPNETTLFDDDETNNWYLIYSSLNGVNQSADQNYINPVEVSLVSDNSYSISAASPRIVSIYPIDIPKVANKREYLTIKPEHFIDSTSYVEYNGIKIYKNDLISDNITRIRFSKINNTDLFFTSLIKNREAIDGGSETITINSQYINFYNINECEIWTGLGTSFYDLYNKHFPINSGASLITESSDSWEDVDLTNPKLIKAFAFPYCPIESLVGKSDFDVMPENMRWNNELNCFSYQAAPRSAYVRQIDFGDISPNKKLFIDGYQNLSYTTPRNIIYESKLLHSDFHQDRFVYDAFNFTFRFEDMNSEDILTNGFEEELYVNYVVSSNILSKFMFQFPTYITDREITDYNNILLIDRNNEKAIYTNAYLNYIRSGGYNFDTKSIHTKNAMNIMGTVFSIVGAIGSFASTPWTGAKGVVGGITLTTGAIKSIANTITSAQEQDRTLAAKVNEAVMNGTKVEGNEDVDLLRFFSQNKAKLVEYEINDTMKYALWDLFYYYGYKTNEYKIPDINTRGLFNFVQADIVFDFHKFGDDVAQDIKNRWKDGITFFHTYLGEESFQYENFEKWLLPTL